jgi:NitT/TauT family transport system ATP-binding protein
VIASASSVSVQDVTVTFPTDSGAVTAVEGVGVEFEEKSFTTMIGPSGSGKSTLLRVIADLIEPNAGSVLAFGRPVAEARRRREIGFVFQDATLLPWRTVIENVRLPLEIKNKEKNGNPAHYQPEELLTLVGLRGRQDAWPHELSGGMRQRVAIARALVGRPRLLLMDEPFGALDEITRDRMNEELLRIWRETDTTIIFVTHSIAEAVYLGQKVLVLSSSPGRVFAHLSVELGAARDRNVRDTPEFYAYTTRLRGLLDQC